MNDFNSQTLFATIAVFAGIAIVDCVYLMVRDSALKHEKTHYCFKCRKIIKGKSSKPNYLIITTVPLRYTRLLSRVQLFLIPWTVACHAPLSMDSPDKNTGVGC